MGLAVACAGAKNVRRHCRSARGEGAGERVGFTRSARCGGVGQVGAFHCRSGIATLARFIVSPMAAPYGESTRRVLERAGASPSPTIRTEDIMGEKTAWFDCRRGGVVHAAAVVGVALGTAFVLGTAPISALSLIHI